MITFRTMLVSLLLALIAVSGVLAQQPQTKTLYITLLTKQDMPMQMPGMGNMKIPGMPTGEPIWSIDARALYEVTPVEPIFVTVPADLKLKDNKLILNVPKAQVVEGGKDEGGDEGGTTKAMQMVNKLYWHPTTAEGPITESFEVKAGQTPGRGMGMNMPDMSQIVREEAAREATGSQSPLPVNVHGQGDYVLNTRGTATLDGFLPPIKILSPKIADLDPAAPIEVKWEPVPGARGYLISAMGTNFEGDENKSKVTMISWYSTLVQPPMRIRGGYQQETTIADDLANGILLPGDTTSCIIPPNILVDVMMIRLRVEAIGNDFYSNTGGTTVFGTIRSEWAAMSMNMGGMGGDEE